MPKKQLKMNVSVKDETREGAIRKLVVEIETDGKELETSDLCVRERLIESLPTMLNVKVREVVSTYCTTGRDYLRAARAHVKTQSSRPQRAGEND